MGLIGAGNNPMVGMTVACAVAVNEALNKQFNKNFKGLEENFFKSFSI